MTKLKYLKLTNGEDIVGIKIEESYWSFKIKSPVQVSSYRIEETGEISFDFVPWSYSANTDLTIIKKKHILGIFDAKQHLKEQYVAYSQYEKHREDFLNQPLTIKQEAIEQYLIKQNLQRQSH